MNKHLIVCDECGKEESREFIGRPGDKWVEVEAIHVLARIEIKDSVHLCSYRCIAAFGARKMSEANEGYTPALNYPRAVARPPSVEEAECK